MLRCDAQQWGPLCDTRAGLNVDMLVFLAAVAGLAIAAVLVTPIGKGIAPRGEAAPGGTKDRATIVLVSCLTCATIVQATLATIATRHVWFADLETVALALLVVALLTIFAVLVVVRRASYNKLLTFYWLLLALSLGVKLQSDMSGHASENTLPHLVTSCVSLALLCILFLSACFKHTRGNEYESLLSRAGGPTGQNAGLVSALTFSYLTPLLSLGYKQRISWDDLPELSTSDSAQASTNAFSSAWLAQAKSEERHPLLKALFSGFRRMYIQAIVFKFGADLLSLAQPQLLRLLMSFIRSADKSPSVGVAIPVIMFLASVVQSLCLHQCFQRLSTTTIRVKSALHSTIYAKSLRLSNGARITKPSGDIMNHMAVDTQRLQDAIQFSQHLWSAPLQILLCLVSLYQLLGASMLTGVLVMVFMLPTSRYLSGAVKKLQKQQSRTKDARSKLTMEIIKMMRSIKLMSWGPSFMEKLRNIRNTQELQSLQKLGVLRALSEFTGAATPYLVAGAAFSAYALTQDRPLTADIVFPAFVLFQLLSAPLTVLPATVFSLTDAAIAAKRLTMFFTAEEIQDDAVTVGSATAADSESILVQNATFAWDSNETTNVLEDVNFAACAGRLTCLVGRIGAGKSALIQAILGNLDKRAGTVSVNGSVAYVAQDHWILNATVRENIVFGREWDVNFYEATVEACALLDDFANLPDGDQTVVGDMGISLSGGQKARISLARAVFSGADIYLFDDILAAVDAHVARHLIDNVLCRRGILASKTIVLATNSEAALAEADSVILIQDGTVAQRPKHHSDAHGQPQGNGVSTAKEATNDMAPTPIRPSCGDLRRRAVDRDQSGRGVPRDQAERSQTGQVKSHVYMQYAKANNLLGVGVYALALLGSQTADIGSSVWLKHWGDTNRNAGDNMNIAMFIGIYIAFGIGSSGLVLLQNFVLWLVCSVRASKYLHESMATAIFRSPMSFFENTPAGQIMNRFSSDLFRVDESLPRQFNSLFVNISKACFILGVISFGTPTFAAFIIPLVIFYISMQRFYLPAKRQLKRLDSSSRSPVFSHFQETLAGVSTIRAYGAGERFQHRIRQLLDTNAQAYLASISANRWLGVRLEFIGAVVVLLAAGFAVASQIFHYSLSEGMAGLTVSYALQITQCLGSVVRASGEVETNIVSVERILEYTSLPSEGPEIVEGHRPPASWIARGDIDIMNFSARYRPELDPVLRDLTLSIKAKESIGVVGRTGAGKSSFALALFRIIKPCHGRIDIDGINTSALGLRDLRKQLTIIPQDTMLFQGTVRENLDPEHIYDDTELWTALELSQLKQQVAAMSGGLDAVISEGGGNLSQGQKQLVALARALLRDSRVLVLDEATAAVDVETDNTIQKIIRQTFRGHATIITIAHRISTIMDSDRVVVLDEGRVVEFDTPAALLARRGRFYSLAREAGLVTPGM